MLEKNEVHVAAALITRDNLEKGCLEVLILQRSKHISGAGFWEFPGGKVESGESPEQALAREIREELNIKIKVEDYVATNVHAYPTKKIRLELYRVKVLQALHFDLMDHQDYAWVSLDEISRYSLSAADLPFVPILREKKFFL